MLELHPSGVEKMQRKAGLDMEKRAELWYADSGRIFPFTGPEGAKSLPGKQIKSKQRVADHGEVFTAEREVNAMLDLVKAETERIDSRFLEPACGEGAFLAEILRRKLAVVKRQYGKSAYDYERYAVLAATSIYGVELLPDNAEACRARLFAIWDEAYTANAGKQANDACRETVKFIPIVFAEWSLVTGDMIKRRDYELDQLLDGRDAQMTLFQIGWEFDEEIQAYIPAPVREYPLTDYRRLAEHE